MKPRHPEPSPHKESDRKSQWGAWLVLLLLVLGLYILASQHPWLARRLHDTPRWFIVLWIIIGSIVLVSDSVTERIWWWILGIIEKIQTLFKTRPFLSSSLVFFVTSLLFYFFRIRHRESGDIYQFQNAAHQGRPFVVPHAPLETVIRFWLREFYALIPVFDFTWMYIVLSCVYGGIYVLLVLWLCAKLPKPYSRIAPLFLLISPTMEIFCGYLEVYSLPLVMELLFLLVGMLFVFRRIAIHGVSLLFGIAFITALWHAFLLPAYLYLVWLAWRRKEVGVWGIGLQIVLMVMPIVAGLACMTFYANPFVGFISRFGESSIFIPFNPSAQSIEYTLFSLRHLSEKANELILIGLAPALFLLCRLIYQPRVFLQAFQRIEFRFLCLALLGALALAFVYYPVLGFPLDWDLFSFVFPCITLAGVSLMYDLLTNRLWKKIVLVLLVGAAAFTSIWILHNALFWNYPKLVTKIGPIISTVIPDFYYKQMQNVFRKNNQENLYWLADEALKESPGKYREIMEFMDEWVITTLTKTPPQPKDLPGWARDVCTVRGTTNRVYVFDKHGRIFIEDGPNLKWIYTPESPLESKLTAGEITSQGAAILLCENGDMFKVPQASLDEGIEEDPVWDEPHPMKSFLPETLSQHQLPVRMVDMEIRGNDQHICVLDNFNRVWDTENEELIFQGTPSYNAAIAFHFTQNYQPVTIDVNNRISYDSRKTRLPFQTDWFYPIVRDFVLTHDNEGLMTLDLNGSIHYEGVTPLYRNIHTTNEIVDRFIKIRPVYWKDALLILDNRYRLYYLPINESRTSVKSKIESLVDKGEYSQAYKHLRETWRKSSELMSTCYDLVDTDFIRAVRGVRMEQSYDEIPLFIDAFPIHDNLVILLDRWGRLVYELQGKSFLLDGSGLVEWPMRDVIDGASWRERIYFLDRGGRIWYYKTVSSLSSKGDALDHIPSLWGDLNAFQQNPSWVSIEITERSNELFALASDGTVLRFDLHQQTLLDTIQLPIEKENIHDFACRETERGYILAYTSKMGPAYRYTSWDQDTIEIPHTKMDWEAISDVVIPNEGFVMVMDRFGLLHPRDIPVEFVETANTTIADAVAFKFYPSGKRAIWLRSNGDRRVYNLKEN